MSSAGFTIVRQPVPDPVQSPRAVTANTHQACQRFLRRGNNPVVTNDEESLPEIKQQRLQTGEGMRAVYD